MGTRSSLLSFLSFFASHGPDFGLHLNLSKCELFWPSADPEFPPNFKWVTGLELLGSSLLGDDNFFKEFLSSCLDKVAVTQDKLAVLDDPQVELHHLCSCLSCCKIIHLF